MSKIDDILALNDIGREIELIKKGYGWRRRPNTPENLSDWFTEGHEIIKDKEKYPDRRILVEKARRIFDKTSGKEYHTDPKYEKEESNRIAMPIEQDQVNIHTSFTVGTKPKIDCTPNNDGEKTLLDAINYTMRKNKCGFLNKQEVRSWLSEQEVAEYWYEKDDTDGFWAKLNAKSGNSMRIPNKRLACSVWSPFRGDHLYPFFEDDNLTGFMREYKRKEYDDSETTCYYIITDKRVMKWEYKSGYQEVFNQPHGFQKMPIIYMYRPEPLCNKIKRLRIRLEKVLSSYGDCIDYNFFPYLLLYGAVNNFGGKAKQRIIEMGGQGASASYLTWQQAPDTVKFEVDTLMSQIYSLTNTPRISLENLKDMGAVSGTAFQFYFMGAHIAVENHAEDVTPFMQRRINFITSALGSENADLYKPSQTIDLETNIVPYMINDTIGKITASVQATGGPIWDKKTGIAFVGNIDNADDVYKQLMAEEKDKMKQESASTEKTA